MKVAKAIGWFTGCDPLHRGRYVVSQLIVMGCFLLVVYLVEGCQ